METKIQFQATRQDGEVMFIILPVDTMKQFDQNEYTEWANAIAVKNGWTLK